jgi:DNA-binding NtrC family response regulator
VARAPAITIASGKRAGPGLDRTDWPGNAAELAEVVERAAAILGIDRRTLYRKLAGAP